MNFFEQQHRARRRTALMLLLFALAVAAIVAVLDLAGAAAYIWLFDLPVLYSSDPLRHVPRHVYVWISALVLVIIAAGTAKRLYSLFAGGVAVADLIGARHVKRDTAEPQERRLLNIVEEMALASGIALPLVFVIDDQHTINAFAAGYSPNEATVIVTRGTLASLNRDELQGVVAHEFSHILNGDMRLNIHLVGVIAGIVVIGSMGAFLMGAGRDSDGKRIGTDIRLFFLGLALWLIGSIGMLAGRLIKAVISRQREFLADASAVQFTRNPDGIGGALFKIGQRGGTIALRHAEELSHMCISAPVSDFFEFEWLRSHPPLDERIERIMGPGAKALLRDRMKRAEAAALAAQGSPVVSEFVSPLFAPKAAAGAGVEFSRAPETIATTSQAVMESVGNPSAAHFDYARRVLDAIPAEIRAAAGSKESARAALFALLLGEGAVREQQVLLIGRESGTVLAERCARFADALHPLGVRVRLPVLGLAIPTLKTLSQPERDVLLAQITALIEADRKVTLGEFVLLTLCRRHFQKSEKGAPPVKHKTIGTAAAQAAVVLSLLAHSGKGGMFAFDKGMSALGIPGGVLSAPAELNIAAVEDALRELNLLAPLKKPLFIKACVEVVMADGKLTVAEGELVRAVCAALDSPLPPILDTAEPVER
jgi:Zn-dependent protease with chaperone function